MTRRRLNAEVLWLELAELSGQIAEAYERLAWAEIVTEALERYRREQAA